MLQGFAGIGAIIATSLLKAVNVFAKAMAAGTAFAILSAIDAIPGASKLLGLGDGVASFSELYNDAEGPVSEGFIEDVGKGGEENRAAFVDKFTAFMDKNMMPSDDKSFKKGNIFENTEELTEKLSKIVLEGFETGKDMIDKSTKANKVPKILNQLSGGGAHVIADSLARVGGGGNALKVGMSLAERSALRTAMATEQTAKATEALAQGMNDGKHKGPAPLGR